MFFFIDVIFKKKEFDFCLLIEVYPGRPKLPFNQTRYFFVLRSKRVVLHGRADGRHLLFAHIQRMRQEEVRAPVAQLPRFISSQPNLLLCYPAARHTKRIPRSYIRHAAIQPSGIHQDWPGKPRRRRLKARRTKGKFVSQVKLLR